MRWGTLRLGALYPDNRQTVDPATAPDELFQLYSVPAYDSAMPEQLPGRSIGSVKQVVSPGDVLLCRIVPHIRRAWIVGGNNGHRLIGSSEWIILRHEKVHPRFLRHFLLSNEFHTQFMMSVAGVGGSLLRARPSAAANIEVPLPPFEEQRRIAATLHKADALREKRRAALQKLDALTQSVFLDMFGDPLVNPMGWPIQTLGQLLKFLQYGPRFYNQPYTESGVRIARITDLDARGRLDFTSMPKLSVDAVLQEKHVLKPGDLIFARTGATVGKLSLIGKGDPPCIAGAYFIRLRFREEMIDPAYIRCLLSSPPIQMIIAKQSRQAAQQNFSGPALRRLRIPLPPLSLQRILNQHLLALETAEKSVERSQNRFEALFSSLQSRAFLGGL